MNQTTEPPDSTGGTTTEPPTDPATDQGPRVSAEQVRDVARMQRSAWDRKIAGVAAGIARHLDIDPTVVRVVLVVLSFFGGAGIVLYAAAWLLVPDERTGHAIVASGGETRRWLLYAALAVAAVIALGGGWGGFGWGPSVPLVLLGVVAVVLLVARDNRRGGAVPPGPLGPGDPHGSTRPIQTGSEGATGSVAALPRAAWAPPPYVPPSARAVRPRRTGVVLFWPTLALIALALGALGIYDASQPVAVTAYAALALAVTGLMLVIGAFRGRPGGLVLLGVVCALALAASSLTGGFARATSQSLDPRTSSAVRPAYSIGTGELDLNLSNLRDVEQLDGRRIAITGDTGQVVVVVPRDLRVRVDAAISGFGGIDVGGATSTGGLDPSVTRSFSGSSTGPVIDLHLRLRVGHIEVRNDYE